MFIRNVLNRARVDFVYTSWLFLFIISLTGFIFNLTISMMEPGYEDSGGIHELRGGFQEQITYPFYFTNQSNFLVIATSFIVLFIPIITKNNLHFKRVKIIMVVNITLTMFIYFGALFPAALKDLHDGNRSPISFASTFFVHLITPVAAISVYLIDSFKVKCAYKTDYIKTIFLNAIYPIIWLIISIGYYYGFGGQPEDAIYSFLDFNSGLTVPLIYIFGIAIAYVGLTALCIFIQNKNVSQ